MAWTTPTIRATGYLVLAADWNTDLVNNLAYLKGQGGQISIEDDIIPASGSLTIGETANPWNLGVFNQLYARRFAVHQAVRTIILPFEDDFDGNWQVTVSEAGGAIIDDGGTGQCRLKVDDNAANGCYIANLIEQNNAKDTSFNASRSPYGRFEFCLDAAKANSNVFIGFRTTPAVSIPSALENHFGLDWDGSDWNFSSANGTNNEIEVVTVTDNVRHVIEILCVSGTQVDCYLDGVLKKTFTSYLPTGDLDWQCMLDSDGAGGATDSILTLGLIILQEDLS
jgi:hypothetical protein